MTVLALVHPGDLLGKEMREVLDRRRDLWSELHLLSDDDEQVGVLTELGGGAALVERLEPDELARVDCAIFCGGAERTRPLLDHLSASATAIVLADGDGFDGGLPLVVGANLDRAVRGDLLVSPHPAVVGTARVLVALRALDPTWMTGTLVEPASLIGGEALDEVLEQTRGILAFRGDWPSAVFGVQAAFNLLPGSPAAGDLGGVLEQVLGEGAPRCALQTLRSGIFHGMSLSACIAFDDDPGYGAVVEALAADPVIEVVEEPDALGPIRAAARDQILVGRVVPLAGSPARYWLWAVFDNLTVGGALNALAILEAITASRVN